VAEVSSVDTAVAGLLSVTRSGADVSGREPVSAVNAQAAWRGLSTGANGAWIDCWGDESSEAWQAAITACLGTKPPHPSGRVYALRGERLWAPVWESAGLAEVTDGTSLLKRRNSVLLVMDRDGQVSLDIAEALLQDGAATRLLAVTSDCATRAKLSVLADSGLLVDVAEWPGTDGQLPDSIVPALGRSSAVALVVAVRSPQEASAILGAWERHGTRELDAAVILGHCSAAELAPGTAQAWAGGVGAPTKARRTVTLLSERSRPVGPTLVSLLSQTTPRVIVNRHD
jgi:hypothetical protein